MGDARAYQVGVKLFLLCIIWVRKDIYIYYIYVYMTLLKSIYCGDPSKMFYPPKGGANALSRWGPLEGLSNLYCTGERKWGFQKHERESTLFESSKNFIVRMDGWVGGW